MTWGVYLTSDDGTPFITDESTPISLQGKYSGTAANLVTLTITVNTDDVVLPFCVASADAYFYYSISGTTLTVNARLDSHDNSSFTFTCYVFTTRSQPLPAWGMALWDRNGKCILTNETKVLTDIKTIGTKGGSGSGLNLSSTLSGRWGILPEVAGFYVGVYQQRPFQIGVGMGAKFDGNNTLIHPILATTLPPGGQLGTPLDAKTVVRAIDLSRYD